MRTAQIGDFWRRVYKQIYNSSISSLRFANLRGVGSGEIEFNGGITAICGSNGAGKTTLLNALMGVLDPEEIINTSASLRKLDGAELFANMKENGNDISLRLSFNGGSYTGDPNPMEIEVIRIDLSNDSSRLISFFSDMTNLEELLETVDPGDANINELELLSYIIGKEYDECQTYEIEMAESGEIPYFRAHCGGVYYGSETMGLGEISVHYILWHLNRASQNSIILIEEPETYLAPRSQEALLNVLAKFSAEKRLWIIITTHSPKILHRIPAEHIRLIARFGNDVEIVTPEFKNEYLSALGISICKTGILFVEDRAARVFAKLWIGRFVPHLVQEFEIIDVGSVSSIESNLKFPKTGNWLKIIGLFDGDQREIINKDYNWPYTFLPGTEAPETLFKQMSNIMEITSYTARTTKDVHLALSLLEGQDLHDWIEEFHNALGIDYNQLMSALFNVWISNPENFKMAENAFLDLVNILNIQT